MVDIRNIEEVVLPSYTYQVKNGRIHGYIDGLEAMRQAVEKILLTERFEWVIYSSNYGVELERLIGKPYDFVKADLERTISQALLVDTRIKSIQNFFIEQLTKDSLLCVFEVHTISGLFKVEKEVTLINDR